jgi:uncharacterized delta-60 repeat protein
MKTLLTIFLLLSLCTITNAQHSFLDSTFGNNGIVLSHYGAATSGSSAEAIAIQPDHKIIIAGGLGAIRYKEDGTFDSSFGYHGNFSNPPFCGEGVIAIQPDGKIILVGTFYDTSVSDFDFLVIRLNTNGSLDTTFGNRGIVTIRDGMFGSYAGSAVALQSDGKIVIAGDVRSTQIGVSRLLQNGTLDSTFGLNGFSNYVGLDAVGVAVMHDGRIVIGGNAYHNKFMAMRLLPDGTPDSSFNHTGVAITSAGTGYNICHTLQLLNDGKVVLGGGGAFGGSHGDFTLIKYTADGILDSSFGDTGVVNVDFYGNDDEMWASSLLPNGKLVLAGYSVVAPNENFALTCIDTNGAIDSTFGNNGRIITQIQSNNDRIHAVAAQPDGKIIAGGYSWIGSYPNNYPELTLARYIPSSPEAIYAFLKEPKPVILYPNPVCDRIKIHDQYAEHIESIYVVDANGNEKKLLLQLNKDLIINNLTPGIYLFQIFFYDRSPVFQKLVIINNK